MKKNWELGIGVVLIIFSLFTYFYLIPHQVTLEAEEGEMSPAFFPRFATIILGILSSFYFIQRAKSSRAKSKVFPPESDLSGVALCGLIISFYTIALSFVGFFICTLIALPVLMLFFGAKSLRIISLSTISITLSIWWFFIHVLMVPLPRWILF